MRIGKSWKTIVVTVAAWVPLGLSLGLALACVPQAAAQGVVANDDFANAAVLPTDGTTSATNVDATAEVGEPVHAGVGGGASVWFRWTAPGDGFVTVDTFGSDFDTVLALYDGPTVDALIELASNDDAISLQSELVNVPVSSGVAYHIAVDGYGGAQGQITLNWSFFDGTDTTPPVVDIILPADGATYGQDSVVPANYVCTDGELGSGVASCVGDLPVDTPVDTTTLGQHTFSVTATDNDGNQAVVSSIYTVVSLPNDDFATPTVLARDGSTVSTTVGATVELGEPDHAGRSGGASVWFQWTASQDGYLTVDTYGSDFDTTLALYTGAAVDTLTELASNDNLGSLQSKVADVPVTAGNVVHIAVDGYLAAQGQVVLTWSFFDGTDTTAPVVTIAAPADGAVFGLGAAVLASYECTDEPLGSGVASCVGNVPSGQSIDTSALGSHPFTVTGTDNAGNESVATTTYTVVSLDNDNFAGAQLLAPAGTTASTNIGATKEPGEPDHARNSGGASVWFKWTAPGPSFLTVDTFGSDFDTLLAVYSGTSVGGLTELAFSDDYQTPQSKVLNVFVEDGESVYIAVDGYFGSQGQITLTWSFIDGTDTTSPEVNIAVPADGASFIQGDEILANYTCTDEVLGTGIASCTGDVAAGAPIDTSTVGDHSFTVTGTDNAGNVTVATSTYSVVVLTNDDFAAATVLGASGSMPATNVGATKEPGEPDHAGQVGGASVWFQWTAPGDGFITVDTYGSTFDTLLGMYTGSAVGALTEVASNDDNVFLQSKFENVFVVGGTVYHIAVDGYFDEGQILLNWTFVDGADTLPPIIQIYAPTDGASLYQGAEVLAEYYCDDQALGSGVASCVGDVPVGSAVDTSTPGDVTFAVTSTDNVGNVSVAQVTYNVVPFTNDNFAAAESIADQGTGTVLRTNVGATREPGEPEHAGNAGGASVWFRWTPPTDGWFSIDTVYSEFDTTLAIYTGATVDTLTEVASNDNIADGTEWSQLFEVPVTAGTTYSIAVDGIDGAMGQIQLYWLFFNGPTFKEVTPPTDPLWVTDADHDFWLNAAAPADVDGDGDLDLAVIGYFVEYNVSAVDRLVIFLNDGPDPEGNWTFTTQDIPMGELYAGSSDLAWGDYDGDGDPDLAVGTGGATEIYRNDAGTLVPIATDLPSYDEDSGYTGAYDLRSLTWADADNDGDLDLLIPSSYDPELFLFQTKLMLNEGSSGPDAWSFVDSGIALDGTIHAQTAWADADGDSDLDLFMANVDNFLDNSFIRTYRNDGGSFASEQPLGSLTIEYGLGDWVDYDQDGDLDILVVGLVQEVDGTYITLLRIYDNEAGLYVPNTIIVSSFFPWLDLHAATWADYDSDGDVDVLVTGSVIGETDIEGRSAIYVNDGGNFRPLGRDLPAPIGTVGRGGTFTWFDIDNDGDLDYLIAGAYYVSGSSGLVEAKLRLFENEAIGINTPPSAPGPAVRRAATEAAGDIVLAWGSAVDDHTPAEAITYDLEVRPAGVTPAQSRKLPELGNVSTANQWVLRGLPAGDYEWRVRAVDNAFNAGPWAGGSFTVDSADSDGDGVTDAQDNCTEVANPGQRDTNGDGYGNLCDADLNNDGIVNFGDLAAFRAAFLTSWPDADFNGDGNVNFGDLALLRQGFLAPPGPSGLN